MIRNEVMIVLSESESTLKNLPQLTQRKFNIKIEFGNTDKQMFAYAGERIGMSVGNAADCRCLCECRMLIKNRSELDVLII